LIAIAAADLMRENFAAVRAMWGVHRCQEAGAAD
jgi:hypothetical protein